MDSLEDMGKGDLKPKNYSPKSVTSLFFNGTSLCICIIPSDTQQPGLEFCSRKTSEQMSSRLERLAKGRQIMNRKIQTA